MEIIKGNSVSDLNENFVENLTTELDNIYSNIKAKNKNISEEITKIYKLFNKNVVPLLEKEQKAVSAYYARREEYSVKVVDLVNEKVKKILQEISEEYKKIYNDSFTTQVASSYSAKMNLIGESDIDYFILFNNLTQERLINISQLFNKYNFKFDKVGGNVKTVNNVYYIFSNVIDDVEVEFKVRDINISKAVIDLHQFIDNKLDKNLKILLTYAKYQLKIKSKLDKSFQGYNYFKTLFYNYCFKGIKNAFLIVI